MEAINRFVEMCNKRKVMKTFCATRRFPGRQDEMVGWSWVRSGFAVSCLMPATTWHGSGNDDNYVAPAPASSVRLRHLRLRLRIRIHILSFGPSFCLHLTAPWRHLTIDEDVEDDSVLVSTPASPLLAPCVVIVLVMAKTLSVVGCSHPGPLPACSSPFSFFASPQRVCHPKMSRVKLSFAR